MDIFGLSDAIKKRRQLLDSIDAPVTTPKPAVPPAGNPSPPAPNSQASGFNQGTIEEIKKRKKVMGW